LLNLKGGRRGGNLILRLRMRGGARQPTGLEKLKLRQGGKDSIEKLNSGVFITFVQGIGLGLEQQITQENEC